MPRLSDAGFIKLAVPLAKSAPSAEQLAEEIKGASIVRSHSGSGADDRTNMQRPKVVSPVRFTSTTLESD